MKNRILEGKRGLIFGALDEHSIAWQVALSAKREGAKFVLSNNGLALRKGDIFELGKVCEAEVIAADVADTNDINELIIKTVEVLGGEIDFILHAVAMSPNVRKNIPYTDLNYDYLNKTLDISAISLHKILSACLKHDALAAWASVVTMSYIGSSRVFESYGDMSHAKALLESIVRNYGYHYGNEKKVRINAISQSPTKTTAVAGLGNFDAFYRYADSLSPLGNADTKSLADFCSMMFSDYTRMVTMQTLYHDGGFSTTGISDKLIDMISD